MILLDETNPVNRAEYARYRDSFGINMCIEADKKSLHVDVSDTVDIDSLPPEYRLGMFLGNSYYLESRDQWWDRVNDASPAVRVVAVRRAMYRGCPVTNDPQFVPLVTSLWDILL